MKVGMSERKGEKEKKSLIIAASDCSHVHERNIRGNDEKKSLLSMKMSPHVCLCVCACV